MYNLWDYLTSWNKIFPYDLICRFDQSINLLLLSTQRGFLRDICSSERFRRMTPLSNVEIKWKTLVLVEELAKSLHSYAGRVHGVMVAAVENGHGWSSSKPGRGCLYSTWC